MLTSADISTENYTDFFDIDSITFPFLHILLILFSFLNVFNKDSSHGSYFFLNVLMPTKSLELKSEFKMSTFVPFQERGSAIGLKRKAEKCSEYTFEKVSPIQSFLNIL